jgi:hypothetical protein
MPFGEKSNVLQLNKVNDIADIAYSLSRDFLAIVGREGSTEDYRLYTCRPRVPPSAVTMWSPQVPTLPDVSMASLRSPWQPCAVAVWGEKLVLAFSEGPNPQHGAEPVPARLFVFKAYPGWELEKELRFQETPTAPLSLNCFKNDLCITTSILDRATMAASSKSKYEPAVLSFDLAARSQASTKRFFRGQPIEALPLDHRLLLLTSSQTTQGQWLQTVDIGADDETCLRPVELKALQEDLRLPHAGAMDRSDSTLYAADTRTPALYVVPIEPRVREWWGLEFHQIVVACLACLFACSLSLA